MQGRLVYLMRLACYCLHVARLVSPFYSGLVPRPQKPAFTKWRDGRRRGRGHSPLHAVSPTHETVASHPPLARPFLGLPLPDEMRGFQDDGDRSEGRDAGVRLPSATSPRGSRVNDSGKALWEPAEAGGAMAVATAVVVERNVRVSRDADAEEEETKTAGGDSRSWGGGVLAGDATTSAFDATTAAGSCGIVGGGDTDSGGRVQPGLSSLSSSRSTNAGAADAAPQLSVLPARREMPFQEVEVGRAVVVGDSNDLQKAGPVATSRVVAGCVSETVSEVSASGVGTQGVPPTDACFVALET